MTLSTQTSKAAFSGNGVSAAFPLAFPFQRDTDIKVLLRQDGFEIPLEAGAHYTLTGAGSPSGGSLVMRNPPATGQTLVVYRAPAIVQEVDYVENSAFPAETHEAALDLLTMICQSLQEQIGRAVLYPVSTPAGDILDSSIFLASTSQSREAARISEQNAAASAGQAVAAASAASASATAAEALAATADGLLKVSMGDATARPLSAKLLAGNGLAEGIENPGGEEALRLAVALAASPGLEFDAGLLRVKAGTGLTLSASGLAADVGASAGKLVQLDASGRIPAVSGALLTGLTAGQISGLSSGMPTGAVIAVASSTVPSGFLECNGAAVSRTTYAALFAAIGVVHGYGDNATTFNLPDYRGRFLRGWDHAIARDPDRASRTAMATGGATGDAVGSVQVDAFKSHTHTYPGFNATVGTDGIYGINPTMAYSVVPSSATGGTETRPINAGVMYCIKY
jgi:microcystin-dependent protein